MSYADWIAADWGNTNLRLWAMGPDGHVLAERNVARGFSGLETVDWEPLLLEICGDLMAPDRATQVVICGAAGSRGGWAEAPYRSVPCTPNGGAEAIRAPARDPRLSVHILPGVNQISPPAVMRSEETQIAGFLAGEPAFDGVLCLPGTHTKWAHISAGEVVSFMSAMTGELFGLLSKQSILRRTIAAEGHDEAAFLDGVEAAFRDPGRLSNALISLRAQALLAGLDPVCGRSRLSGLLVGADLTAARLYWLGREVVVIGADRNAENFHTALAAQGVPVRVKDGKAAALAGLIAAHESLA
jgi:2-dehydro-3-deoxygalactonokinase